MVCIGRKRKASSSPNVASRRLRAADVTPAQWRDWTSLPADLTNLVVERLLAEDMTDYMCFRAVCSHWRACTASPCDPTLREIRFRPRGWVALCDGDGVRPADACEIAFFHATTSRHLRVRLPELQNYRIIGFTDGLLILMHKSTTSVRVLHPFTLVFVDLPPLATIFHHLVKDAESRAWPNAALCWSYASISVVVWFPDAPVVIWSEPEQLHWVVIHRGLQLWTALPFQGKLFGIRKITGQLVQVYPPNLQYPVVAHAPKQFRWPMLCYLVNFEGHMLLIIQHSFIDLSLKGWQPFAFALFLVDIHRRELSALVGGLGDRALFLNKDRSICVSAKDLLSISRNSIYFSMPMNDPVVLHCLSSRLFERTSTLSVIHDLKERI